MDAVEINTSDPSQDEIASPVKICRVCLLGDLMMRDLFVESEVASLSAKAMSFANVKMLPGDGLPMQICLVCADKLELAYEFKLQVEQADNMLREKLDMKELFLNEAEIHLNMVKHDSMEEMNVNANYKPSVEVLPEETVHDKNFLKDQLIILEAGKLADTEELQHNSEDDNSQEMMAKKLQEELANVEDTDASTLDESRDEEPSHEENIIRSCTDAIPAEEHDYIMQQQCILPAEQLALQEEMQEKIQAEIQGEMQRKIQEEIQGEIHEAMHGEIQEAMQGEIQQELQREIQQELQGEIQQELQGEIQQELQGEIQRELQGEIQEEMQGEIQGEIQEEMQGEIQEDVSVFVQETMACQEISEQNHEIPVEQNQETRADQIQDIHAQIFETQADQEEQIRIEHEKEIYAEESERIQTELSQEAQSEQNQNEMFNESSKVNINESVVEQESSQNETRRSKRRLARRAVTERDSDEENYFENLNLSSRLKKAQADKAEKIFFMCYLCDKQFLSKSILKEHMHSHEEVRKILSLKKTPEKLQKAQGTVCTNTPPSGKKANKCFYCGKEYLYIISFMKHVKRHERQQLEKGTDDSMKLEVSFLEDEQNSHLDNKNSEDEYKEQKRGLTTDDDANDSDDDKRRKRSRVEEFSCTKCPRKFDTKRGLQKHSSVHNNFKCSVCNEEYDTLEQLRNHRTKHVVEGVLSEQDLEMNTITTKSENVDESNKNVEDDENNDKSVGNANEMKPSTCSMTFSRKKALSKHKERKNVEHHGRIKTYGCTQCNKTFSNELTLRNHLIATSHKTFIQGQEYDPNKRIKRVAARAAQKIIDKIKTEHGLDDYDDNDDNIDYDAKLDGYYHNKRIITPKKFNCKKEFECATCNKRYSSKQALTKHMEQHVKEETAEKAEKLKKAIMEKKEAQKTNVDNNDDNDNDSDFESGLDWPMDNHECTTCKKRYSTKKSLLRHQLLHEEPNFECDICNVKFYRKDKLKAHYDKCSEKNPDQVRKCIICNDTFENNELLRQHRAKHVTDGILTEEDLRDIEPKSDEKRLNDRIGRKRRTDIVGLECTECNKQYTNRKGLLRHIQVHEGKKYLCDICPKKFYRREHLKIHVAKHNMIKPYKCTRCSKRFIKEEQLNNHLPKHDRAFKKRQETDSSKRYLCEICSKSFTQSTTLIAHLRAHKGIKPFVCEVCSRPFTTNAYLKMHMRTHTQERPYICQYCSRAFARADTLANHLTSHTGEAKYHCKCCPKNFRRLKSLKEHMFIHTGQRPYECPTCDRKFNNNGSRYAHSKRCKQNLLQNQNRTQQMMQQAQQQQQSQPQQQQEEEPQPQPQPQPQQLQIQIQHQEEDQQPQQMQIQMQQTQSYPVRLHPTTMDPAEVVKHAMTQNIRTITLARPADPNSMQQVVPAQEILMPLILPLAVTLTDVGEEVILPEGTKIFTS